MRATAAALALALLAASVAGLKVRQEPTRPANYRNAWDDCGGAGASSTERMRSIAASIKGFAPFEPFKAHAAQDCGKVDAAGFTPGVRGDGVKVYPGITITKAASDGLTTAATALEKYR